MRNFVAITESGTRYAVDDHFVRITSKAEGTYSIKLWTMKVSLVDEDSEKLMVPWANPEQWASATEPVVGRRLYVSGKDDWRISTPIKDVTFH